MKFFTVVVNIDTKIVRIDYQEHRKYHEHIKRSANNKKTHRGADKGARY